MELIIPLLAITSLDPDRYPGVKSRYLAGYPSPVNCNFLKLIGILSSKDNRQHALGITSAPPSTTVANCVSNTPNKTPPEGQPTPHPTQPPSQSSAVAYSPPRGVTWKFTATIMQEEKSCLGCHYIHPKYPPQLKFHQEVGCLSLANHDYLCRKDVTASAKAIDKFNTKLPKTPDQYCPRNPVAKRVSFDQASDHVSTIRVHPP